MFSSNSCTADHLFLEGTPALEIHDLWHRYDDRVIFRAFSVRIEAGEWVAVTGPSGVGKTTLLRLIAGLDQPASGSISCSGPVAYLSQGDDSVPWGSVLHNALLGLALSGVNITTQHEQAIALLHRVGLGQFIQAYPHQLSGGMRRRLNWVRVALLNRSIILLDEPFVGLDPVTRQELEKTMRQLFEGRTVMIVTHHIDEIASVTDRVIALHFEGRG